VLIWNYRGYGLTKPRSCCFKYKNKASPQNFKRDSEALMMYLRN